MQRLGESWDVVEVVRSLVTEVDSLQKIVARQEARLQVLERAAPRPLIQVGTLVAEDEAVTAGASASRRSGQLTTKGRAREGRSGGRATNRKFRKVLGQGRGLSPCSLRR